MDVIEALTPCISLLITPLPGESPLLPNLRILNILIDSDPSYTELVDESSSILGAPGTWPNEMQINVEALVMAGSIRCTSDIVGVVPLVQIRVNREALTRDWPFFDGFPPDGHFQRPHVELVGESLLDSTGESDHEDRDGSEGSDWEDSGLVRSDDELDEEYDVPSEEEITEEEISAMARELQAEHPSWLPPPGRPLSSREMVDFGHVLRFLGPSASQDDVST